VQPASWAILCTILVPLYLQWHWQTVADAERSKEYATCAQLTVDQLSCFDMAERNWSARSDDRLLKRFWVWDAAFWKFELVDILFPPAVVYALSVLMVWIWRGFKSPTVAG
jgi:hypothetical protein